MAGGKPLDAAWAQTSVLLVGLGGVGSPLAQFLTRSGLGKLTLVDGDRVAVTDLHRQVLYDDEDVLKGTPKAEAACRSLQRIGGRTSLHSYAGMLTPRNADELFGDHEFVIDATDHIAARSLIQEVSLRTGIGWFHSAAIADRWVAASFTPPGSPCYHCWVSRELNHTAIGTCETEGVLPASCLAAASAVLRLLTETLHSPAESQTPGSKVRRILRGSLGTGEEWIELVADPECPTCSDSGLRDVESGSQMHRDDRFTLRKLCGSGTLEVWIDEDLEKMQSRLLKSGQIQDAREHPFSLRIVEPTGVITCYRDGRALITGELAQRPEVAKERLAQILDC